jgi:hypothetical protein
MTSGEARLTSLCAMRPRIGRSALSRPSGPAPRLTSRHSRAIRDVGRVYRGNSCSNALAGAIGDQLFRPHRITYL